jgi:hypothetical protein
MEKPPQVEVVPLESVLLDDRNANKGTVRGRKLLKESIKKFGAGRSILLDSNNTVISGNKTLAAAKSQGYKRVQIIDADGDTLIAVRRKDLNLKRDKKARELAIAENRTSEVDLSWDPEILSTTDADLGQFFEPIELDNLLNEGKGHKRTDKIDLQEPPKMLWVLLGIPFNRFDAVQAPLAILEAESEISVQQARSDAKEK